MLILIPKNRWPISNQARIHPRPLAFTSLSMDAILPAFTQTACPTFPTPAIIEAMRYNSPAVDAKNCSASPVRDIDPRPAPNCELAMAPPGESERDGAIPANCIPHVMVGPMAPACICKHLNRLLRPSGA